MEAHDSAYFDAQILHCNINIANIVTSATGRGLLVDWELSVETRSFRTTGTWQYMSAALLRKPQRVQTLEDDRESAIHVLTWLALRFSEHDELAKSAAWLKMYDEVDLCQSGGVETGGMAKGNDFSSPALPNFKSIPLNLLLRELRKNFWARYGEQYSADEVLRVKDFVALLEKDPALDAGMADMYRQLAPYAYASSMEALVKRNWLVEVFNKHLKAEDWPSNDKAAANEIISSKGSRQKRY
ncbi:hypothetical protein M413DRAFT_447193 [Hebeloma cylindrosporum]|uniref:Fungal-type protein kinase domain-containing protein n=1 Tax=Hebeloma cylindrosporum TaxID=76867 RepID=A0A0C3BRE9_HEBCY|nr:hypothetical protein M413DRAFT_447193 [Hebeloma cylindrosporum h7]